MLKTKVFGFVMIFLALFCFLHFLETSSAQDAKPQPPQLPETMKRPEPGQPPQMRYPEMPGRPETTRPEMKRPVSLMDMSSQLKALEEKVKALEERVEVLEGRAK